MDKLLESVPQGQEFKLSSGRVLKNLYELSNALISMDKETFYHHVNSEKNDFASWIRHVYEDVELANALQRLKSQEAIANRISKRLAGIGQEKKAAEKKVEKKVSKPKKVVKKAPEKEHILDTVEKVQKEETKKKKAKEKKKEAAPKKEVLATKKEQDAFIEKSHKESHKEHSEIAHKLDEVLRREKEIGRREEKIQEIEHRIERDLHVLKQRKRSEAQFFSREFVQGLVAGFLITLIGFLLYIKLML